MPCRFCGETLGLVARLRGAEYCSHAHMLEHRADMASIALIQPYYGPRGSRTKRVETPSGDNGPARRALLATSIGLGLGMLAQPEWLFPGKAGKSDGSLPLAAGTGPRSVDEPMDGPARDPAREMTQPFELSAQALPDGWTTQGRGKLWEVENNWLTPRASGLFTPSQGMKDGTMAYLLQILAGGANFLMRAQDLGNHYAVRLRSNGTSVSPSNGPMTLQAVSVRNGVERIVSQERIAETVTWFRTIHHLDVQLDGDFFTARLNDTIVGTWRDRTFARGAIGVDVTQADQFRVYQGKVTPA
ncbi:MAG: hypothetical protein R2762_02970 [Bryobacteraceae bacterium]